MRSGPSGRVLSGFSRKKSGGAAGQGEPRQEEQPRGDEGGSPRKGVERVLVLVTHHVYETVTEHYVRPVYRVITVHPLVVPFVNQKMLPLKY